MGIVFIIIAVLQFGIFVSSINLACWAGMMQACALEPPKPNSNIVITTGALVATPMATPNAAAYDRTMVVLEDKQQFS